VIRMMNTGVNNNQKHRNQETILREERNSLIEENKPKIVK